jgi:hypothetical protein
MSADDHLSGHQFPVAHYTALRPTPEGDYEEEHRTVQGPFYHGGSARLQPGGMITTGRKTQGWGDEGARSTHVYFSTDRGSAESYTRALGKRGRLYEVEPTGEVKMDYQGTDFKSVHPLRVLREIRGQDNER